MRTMLVVVISTLMTGCLPGESTVPRLPEFPRASPLMLTPRPELQSLKSGSSVRATPSECCLTTDPVFEK